MTRGAHPNSLANLGPMQKAVKAAAKQKYGRKEHLARYESLVKVGKKEEEK